MKKLFLVVVAALVLFVMTVPVTAQVICQTPLEALVDSNIAMVNRFGARAQMALSPGGYNPQQIGYMGYDPYMMGGQSMMYPQMGYMGQMDPCMMYAMQVANINEMNPVIWGAVGAAGGGVIFNNQRGAIAGATIGAVAGMIKNSRDRKKFQQAYAECQMRQQMAYQQSQASQQSQTARPQTVGYGSPRGGTVENRSSRSTTEEGFIVKNSTGYPVELYDGNEYLGRMSAGQELDVPAPQKKYRGVALIPQNDGSLGKGTACINQINGGWEFVPPQF